MNAFVIKSWSATDQPDGIAPLAQQRAGVFKNYKSQ